MMKAGVRKEPAQKVWKDYNEGIKAGYVEAQSKFNENVEASETTLRSKWGEKYQENINLGQSVIDAVATSQEQKDYLTATLSQDAYGLEALATIGINYKESSIGGFQEKQSFSYTPEEATSEIATIKASAEYYHDDIKVRQPLIDKVTRLRKAERIK